MNQRLRSRIQKTEAHSHSLILDAPWYQFSETLNVEYRCHTSGGVYLFVCLFRSLRNEIRYGQNPRPSSPTGAGADIDAAGPPEWQVGVPVHVLFLHGIQRTGLPPFIERAQHQCRWRGPTPRNIET